MYNKTNAYLLWLFCFVGICGVQRFYLGQVGMGLLYLFTFGLCGVGQFIDLFILDREVDKMNSLYGSRRPPRQIHLQGTPGMPPYPPPHSYPHQPPFRMGTPPAQPPQPKSDLTTLEGVEIALAKAAKNRGNKLTLLEAVVELNLRYQKIEKVLDDMASKGYVELDPSTGTVVYIFK